VAIAEVLDVINYVLVLIYGVMLSTHIAGGVQGKKQRLEISILCLLLLLVQGIIWYFYGAATVRLLYPLIAHLPLILALMLILKKSLGIAAVSVTVGYLCCQLPRWVRLMILALGGFAELGEIGYMLAIGAFYGLLYRWFVPAARSTMTFSRYSLMLFGSLPIAYYCFDYATAVYSSILYDEIKAISEFLPTILIIFYVLFMAMYHVQVQKRTDAELQSSMLDAQLRQAETEIEGLRHMQTNAAIYQHDMRHHLTIIENMVTSGKVQQAQEYIRKVYSDVEAITPRSFCENGLVNMLCSSFSEKAQTQGIELRINAKLPRALSVSDTELCAVVSNALENALLAAGKMDVQEKWVNFYCEVKRGKLLIETENPYSGEITMRDGLPVSEKTGHGYGCRSIRSIVTHHRGICSFETEGGLFTFRAVLPLTETPEAAAVT